MPGLLCMPKEAHHERPFVLLLNHLTDWLVTINILSNDNKKLQEGARASAAETFKFALP